MITIFKTFIQKYYSTDSRHSLIILKSKGHEQVRADLPQQDEGLGPTALTVFGESDGLPQPAEKHPSSVRGCSPILTLSVSLCVSQSISTLVHAWLSEWKHCVQVFQGKTHLQAASQCLLSTIKHPQPCVCIQECNLRAACSCIFPCLVLSKPTRKRKGDRLTQFATSCVFFLLLVLLLK